MSKSRSPSPQPHQQDNDSQQPYQQDPQANSDSRSLLAGHGTFNARGSYHKRDTAPVHENPGCFSSLLYRIRHLGR